MFSINDVQDIFTLSVFSSETKNSKSILPALQGKWLSLGTMSASAYIDNLAKNSTYLINYQELTRSI